MPNLLPVVSVEGPCWVCNFVIESLIPFTLSSQFLCLAPSLSINLLNENDTIVLIKSVLIQLFYSQELLAAMASERLLKSRSLSSAASTSLRFHENFDFDHVSNSNKSDNLSFFLMLNCCFNKDQPLLSCKIDSFRTLCTRMTPTLMT